MGTLQNVLPTIIQPQSRLFQKGMPMLLSAMQKGHFPFKKGTFSHHFKSWGARAPSAPPFLRPWFCTRYIKKKPYLYLKMEASL